MACTCMYMHTYMYYGQRILTGGRSEPTLTMYSGIPQRRGRERQGNGRG